MPTKSAFKVVRLDGEAELAASLLAQRLLLAPVLLAVLLALVHGLRKLLLAFLDLDLALLVVIEALAVDFGRRRRRRRAGRADAPHVPLWQAAFQPLEEFLEADDPGVGVEQLLQLVKQRG